MPFISKYTLGKLQARSDDVDTFRSRVYAQEEILKNKDERIQRISLRCRKLENELTELRLLLAYHKLKIEDVPATPDKVIKGKPAYRTLKDIE